MGKGQAAHNGPQYPGHLLDGEKGAAEKSHGHNKEVGEIGGILMGFGAHPHHDPEGGKEEAVEQQGQSENQVQFQAAP